MPIAIFSASSAAASSSVSAAPLVRTYKTTALTGRHGSRRNRACMPVRERVWEGERDSERDSDAGEKVGALWAKLEDLLGLLN